MKTVPVKTITVNMQTGEQTEKESKAFIAPPAPDACQECGTKHSPESPHNQQSLYYQYAFYGQHGRWPTWADALEHCSDAMKKAWADQLAAHDITVYPEEGTDHE